MKPLDSKQRIVIVGTSGSGKTTLAKQLAAKLGIDHIELDALNWDANWTMAPDFVDKVAVATSGDNWVVDGNYSRARDVTWARANTIVWLDYPMWLNLWRITKRTLRRSILKVELWNGNRESLREFLFGDESMFRWVLKTHKRRQRDFSRLIAENKYPHVNWVRLQSPRATEMWLKTVKDNRKA